MTARVLLIDNYDSFTYNLAQSFLTLGAEIEVIRNDQITVDQARAKQPTHLVISPGPGRPEDAGVSMDMIQAFRGVIPVFGVCLGHQSLAEVSGGDVVRAPRLMHGKSSDVYHDGKGLFAGLPSPVQVARYHSLIVDPQTVPDSLEVSAYTAEGEIMGLRAKDVPLVGVQFHPESVLTPQGDQMIANFLAMEAR